MLSVQLDQIICSYVPPESRQDCTRAVEIALQNERRALLGSLQTKLSEIEASNKTRQAVDSVIFDERLLF